MIRMTMMTDKGPIGIVGIDDENLIRMQAGMSLNIDLKAMTPPGTRLNRIVVHYAHTYADVVEDIAEGGFSIPDEVRQEARKLDDQLKEERTKKRR